MTESSKIKVETNPQQSRMEMQSRSEVSVRYLLLVLLGSLLLGALHVSDQLWAQESQYMRDTGKLHRRRWRQRALCRPATGALLFLRSNDTRSDVPHAVMVLTRRVSKPAPKAAVNLKRVFWLWKRHGSIWIFLQRRYRWTMRT